MDRACWSVCECLHIAQDPTHLSWEREDADAGRGCLACERGRIERGGSCFVFQKSSRGSTDECNNFWPTEIYHAASPPLSGSHHRPYCTPQNPGILGLETSTLRCPCPHLSTSRCALIMELPATDLTSCAQYDRYLRRFRIVTLNVRSPLSPLDFPRIPVIQICTAAVDSFQSSGHRQ